MRISARRYLQQRYFFFACLFRTDFTAFSISRVVKEVFLNASFATLKAASIRSSGERTERINSSGCIFFTVVFISFTCFVIYTTLIAGIDYFNHLKLFYQASGRPLRVASSSWVRRFSGWVYWSKRFLIDLINDPIVYSNFSS